MCSEPVTCERGRTRLSAHMKAYGPDQLVLPTLGSTNNLGLSAAHAQQRPDRGPDGKFRQVILLGWTMPPLWEPHAT